MTTVAIITAYHFGTNNEEPYARLLRGLESSLRQLSDGDRLILVANGVGEGAADPDVVLKRLDPPHPDRIVPVVLSQNAKNTGALNVGVAVALRQDCRWIAQVQSSVVLKRRWLETLRPHMAEESIDGFRGRLTYEDAEDTIWTDGHYLEQGRTLDERWGRPLADPGAGSSRWVFPCLSAAMFSVRAVRLVLRKYGNFVAEGLAHYGDCTDVALRLARLRRCSFCHIPEAIGTKRRPSLDRARVLASQLLAAQRYYRGKANVATERMIASPQDVRYADDALRQCGNLSAGRYSPRKAIAPFASPAEDQEWGVSCGGCSAS